MGIREYFGSDEMIREALEKYKNFSEKKKWSIKDKFGLYKAADTAFGSSHRYNREEFKKIYEELRGYWQVGRNGSLMESGEILDILENEDCDACSRAADLTLANLKENGQAEYNIKRCLNRVKGIKKLPSGGVSITAVSKFLHFFNPKLFPICDKEFIRDGVLRIFGREWKSFVNTVDCDSPYEGIRIYFPYILWANQIICQECKNIMDIFTEWADEQAGQNNTLNYMKDCYATAFEFIAIGASLMEKNAGK